MNITESTLRIANEIRSEIVFDDDEIDEEEESYATDDWVKMLIEIIEEHNYID